MALPPSGHGTAAPGSGSAAALAELDKCVHCGFCLNACPTYDLLREEPDSPRGRIALIAAVEEGRLEPGERFAQHMFACVGCRACESACPAGVAFGRLLEHARARIGPQGTPAQRSALWLAFRHLLPYPRRLRLVVSLLRVYQRSGLRSVLRRSGLLARFGAEAERLDAMLPALPDRFFSPPVTVPPVGPRRYRVGLLSGCVMSTLFTPSNEATLRLLQHAGCEVVIPRGQVCCGALNIHNGDPDGAKAMARRNIAAFAAEELDAIIVNAAGCGATMKEYGDLLADDAAWCERARHFAGKVRDVCEFLDAVLPPTTVAAVARQRVTYQDPCHLAHGQGVRTAPRRLLDRIEGIELVEMPQSDRCCGSAGIYNIMHPELAEPMLAAKMQHIAATGAERVIAPNPGCILQLRYGAQRYGPAVRVDHLVDLLAEVQGLVP